MKKILLFTAFILVSVMGFSQDFIILKKDVKPGMISTIVTEITPTHVWYRLFREPKGKIYSVPKSDVESIMYQDGRVELFDQSDEPTTVSSQKEVKEEKADQEYPEYQEPGSFNRNSKYPKFYLGPGFGLDYGGYGGKFEYLPIKNLGVFASAGYNLLNLGWNVGGAYKILPDKKVSPNLMMMFGYNAVYVVIGGNSFTKQYETTSYGVTLGANVDIKIGRNNKISAGLLIPFRSKKFKDNYTRAGNDPNLESIVALSPILVSAGFNFELKK